MVVNNEYCSYFIIVDNFQVSFFRPWIDCIISAAQETRGVKAQVEERCSKVAESLVPDCLDTKDLMFDLDSLNTTDDSFAVPRCDPNPNCLS